MGWLDLCCDELIEVAQYLSALSESINGLLTEATMDGWPAL
jgi:hypothetical protein